MLWIGLTGGIGTGKSSVAKILQDQGLAVIDADEVAHEVMKAGGSGAARLRQIWGEEFFLPSGEMDRKKVATLVFSNPAKLAELESVVHPLVKTEVAKRRANFGSKGHKIVFYDVPLLFEKNLQSEFDGVVLVYASPETQRRRLLSARGYSEEETSKRMASQLPIDAKLKLATWVIQNEGTKEQLTKAVEVFLSHLR